MEFGERRCKSDKEEKPPNHVRADAITRERHVRRNVQQKAHRRKACATFPAKSRLETTKTDTPTSSRVFRRTARFWLRTSSTAIMNADGSNKRIVFKAEHAPVATRRGNWRPGRAVQFPVCR